MWQEYPISHSFNCNEEVQMYSSKPQSSFEFDLRVKFCADCWNSVSDTLNVFFFVSLQYILLFCIVVSQTAYYLLLFRQDESRTPR